MQDGTPWPGNNTRDHPGMIQVVCLLVYLTFFWLVEYLWSRTLQQPFIFHSLLWNYQKVSST